MVRVFKTIAFHEGCTGSVRSAHVRGEGNMKPGGQLCFSRER